MESKQLNSFHFENCTYGPELRTIPAGLNHKIYIYGEIEEICDYVDSIFVLDNADENDVIDIHIATPGGRIDTAIALIHAILRCKATTVGHADSEIYSAGVPIFLACSQYVISEFSTFMVHDGNYGSMSKINEHLKYAVHSAKQLAKLYNTILYPVFSKDEIEHILDGKDIYLDSSEMIARLELAKDINNQPEEFEETEDDQN